MTSTTFGATALIVLRSFPRTVRASSGTRARYSSTSLTGELLVLLFPSTIVSPLNAACAPRLVSLLAVNHPRRTESIPQHAETNGPEGLLDRHLYCPAFCQGVKYAFCIRR